MTRIVVVPYDPLWGQAFTTSSGAVAAAMGSNLLAIHHIGSTSIPGMYAKPVIDMLAVVSEIGDVDHHIPELAALGYEAKGEFGIRVKAAAGGRVPERH